MTPLRHLVIVGGGTAGWMAAAAAARFLSDGQRRITLVESETIGTVGVGEATIPPILGFNRLLGIDEDEFLAATGATFKLGIEFVGWGAPGERYLHPFGSVGQDIVGTAFHQYWLKHRAAPGVGDYGGYSMSAAAARAGRFAPATGDPRDLSSQVEYAYHFDAALYAAFLRRRAEEGGVARVEGRIASVERDPASGDVAAVVLEDGHRIAGDLFIDCSGFRSLLLGDAMAVGYDDWSRWLPCDRALAVPSASAPTLTPYTRATAHAFGWQWRIPLQHRIGNGLVYSSAHVADEAARQALLGALDTAPAAEPRCLSFTAGVRMRQWEGNVVALGLAAGFVEPLESTSIHLIQTGISKLFWLFPGARITEVEREEYNRLMRAEYEYVRDFIVLHYHANARPEPFWRDVRAVPLPDSLAHKLALWHEKGRVLRYDHDLFGVPNWVAVLLGQNMLPDGYDPLVDATDETRVLAAMAQLRQGYTAAAARLPEHRAYLERRLAAQRAGGVPMMPAR